MLFSQVIGQSTIKEKLLQQAKEDKISHAQLFVGKPGFGSLPMAIAFAQFILCENRQEHDACGTCSSCLKVQHHQHADLHYIFPVIQEDKNRIAKGKLKTWRAKLEQQAYFDLNDWINELGENKTPIISVHEAEDLMHDFNLKAYEGGMKIGIIWMAQQMNVQCANKILKILEEPSPNTLFILIAEEEQQLLQTIRSRTQMLRFPRLKTSEIEQHLIEKHQFSAQKAHGLSVLANGDFVAIQEHLKEQENGTEDTLFTQTFIQLMRVCYKKEVIAMLDWVDLVNQKPFTKNNQKQFLLYANHMIRQSILKNYTGEQLLTVSDQESQFLEKFAQFITGNNVYEFMDLFDQAFYQLDRNANSKILFTELCFNVMRYIRKA